MTDHAASAPAADTSAHTSHAVDTTSFHHVQHHVDTPWHHSAPSHTPPNHQHSDHPHKPHHHRPSHANPPDYGTIDISDSTLTSLCPSCNYILGRNSNCRQCQPDIASPEEESVAFVLLRSLFFVLGLVLFVMWAIFFFGGLWRHPPWDPWGKHGDQW